MRASWSGQVAIAGVCESPRRRAPGMHPFAIQAECAAGALADAGLELADIDGLATAASFPAEGAREMAVAEIAEYLGVHPRWVDGTDIGGAAPISHAGHAVAAIAAGLADVVLVTHAACGYSWPYGAPDYLTYSHGPGQWELPYGPSTVATYALAARRHMHDYGTTAEDLAAIAVQCRANAATNPHARYSAPISADDVLDSPVIADHCVHCFAPNPEWAAASGRGRLHTYSIVERTPNAEFAADCPYILAVIELDEGPRMTARIAGDAGDIACDRRVHAVFTPASDAVVLPNFALDTE
jgi:acetyl-CoA acetyltransferase